MQSNKIIESLENDNSKTFIVNHLKSDLSSLALKYQGKVNFDLLPCLELLKVYQKGAKKLPSLCASYAALTDRSYQQSSSEQVAEFKSKLVSGDRMLDLTGGLGIDDIAFARSFKSVVSVDPDIELNKLVRYNLALLDIQNVERFDQKAEETPLEGYSWIYLDPDRRVGNQRVHGLDQMIPDVLPLIPRILSSGANLALKLSPMYEATELFKQQAEVSDVYVISQDNEVKELLAVFQPSKSVQHIHAVNLGNRPYVLESRVEHMNSEFNSTEEVLSHVYLPLSALLKSRMAVYYANQLGMKAINGHHVFTSEEAVVPLGFKGFVVLWTCQLNAKKVAKKLKQQGVERANVLVKGNSVRPEQWYGKLNLKQGGSDMLMLLFGNKNQAVYARLLF